MNLNQIIIIETIYALAIILPSLIIFNNLRQMHKFSSYKGLTYFSKAFLFIAIGFLFRYIVMLTNIFNMGHISTINEFNIFLGFMEFFMIIPAFYLLYSIIWKKFEKEKYSKCIITYPELIFFIITAVLVLLDFLIMPLIFLYASQIIIYSVASVISYLKFNKNKNKFRFYYFISMILFLIVWVINLIAQHTIQNIPIIRIYTYIITVFAILILYYMNNKLITKK